MIKRYDFDVCLIEEATADDGPMEEMANRLFEAGCDDQMMSTTGNVVTLSFYREAESLGAAIDSAMRDIRKAGYTPSKVMVDAMPQVAGTLDRPRTVPPASPVHRNSN